jgi:aryl-alcohol dehydrogenase-like predicted oxidoreductase
MMRRTLGRSGIEVSGIGMGCWAIGGPFYRDGQPCGWGEVDDEESVRAVHRALDLGVDFFDTADVYGAGHSERVLARALAGRREQAVIATKWGNVFDEDTKQMTGRGEDPAYLREAVDASLRRLGTDYIDLYQLHLNDLALDKAAELLGTLEALVEEGKIRSYGWSTDFAERAESWGGAGERCTAIQHDFSLMYGTKPEVLEAAERHGLASINRGPLAMGLLTGKYKADTRIGADDVRGSTLPWMVLFKDGRPAPEYLAKLEAVRDVLTADGRTLAQGALGWLWAVSDATVPIPGCRTVAQVEENAGALERGPLTSGQVKEIEALLAVLRVSGSPDTRQGGAVRFQVSAASTAGGAAPNEDHYLVSDRWALVLDGITRYPDDGCVHDVPWYVSRLGAAIAERIAAPSVTAALAESIANVNAQHDGCDLRNPVSPGAAVGIVRLTGAELEWALLGDCSIVWRDHEGTLHVRSDDRLADLRDPPAAVDVGEIRRYPVDYIARVRNREGGFWVGATDPGAAAMAYTGSVRADRVSELLLCTDGLTRLTERYGHAWPALFARLAADGVEGLIRLVREHGEGDRVLAGAKRHDDATGIHLRLPRPRTGGERCSA